jgi:hypothetical protein
MTTKELIHEKVELLDEDRAKLILTHVEDLLEHSQRYENIDMTSGDQFDEEHDPLLDLIGMVRSSEPTNVAEFKDDYIVDAIASHGESTD